MSSPGGRARVRVVPGRDPGVWVKRDADDLPIAALGEAGPDGWAPVLVECEISVDARGVHINLTGSYEEGVDNPDDVTGYFPIEQVMAEHVAAPHIAADHDTVQFTSAEHLAAENLVSEPPLAAAESAPNLRGPTGTWPVPRPGAEPSKSPSGPAATTASAPETSGPPGQAVGPSFARAWRETSPPRKVLAVLLPFALAFSVAAVIRRSRAPVRVHAPAAIASTASSASVTSTAAAAAPTAEPAPIAAVASGSASSGTSVKTPTKKTLERSAVDAVAAGSYAEALAHYEELSRRSPDVPAYRHAVRILKVKIAAGSGHRP